MKLKNVLIVVKDMEKSIAFYRELFGLEVLLHQEGNVILTEGLVLQEAEIWKESTELEVIFHHHAAELYFEERDMEGFIQKLEAYQESIRYVQPLTKYSWGRQAVRFYDLDGNLIEVGTPQR